MSESWLDEVVFDAEGLVPAVAQEASTGKLLMRAVYWSRSRKRLWRKGEESGHTQLIKQVRLDCDADVIVLEVEQVGGIACHTGHSRCFFRKLENGMWVEAEAVLKDPGQIYDSKP